MLTVTPSSVRSLICAYSSYYLLGRDSSIGIATDYGLESPGIECRWGRDFPHPSRPALGPTQIPVQWVPDLSWGKERPGGDADPSPLLVPLSRESRAIPLLPLWVVRPVQSLSACTTVNFSFTFKITAEQSNIQTPIRT